jgi:hypothetical protein
VSMERSLHHILRGKKPYSRECWEDEVSDVRMCDISRSSHRPLVNGIMLVVPRSRRHRRMLTIEEVGD